MKIPCAAANSREVPPPATTAQEVLQHHYSLETVRERDVTLLNRARVGETRIPDTTIFSLVFHGGKRIDPSGSIAHHADLVTTQAAGIGIMTEPSRRASWCYASGSTGVA